jgi:hypothetical protein
MSYILIYTNMKKQISNSEELNKYYKIINTKLKKFSDMNIPQNKIAKYLKPGSENFKAFIKSDEELKDIENIETVLKDIIEDTYAAYKDGLFKNKKGNVEKFENFLIKENVLNLELSDGDIHNHEKALADIYKVSISYIDVLDPKIHLYKVNDNGRIRKSMVLTISEINRVKIIIIDHLALEINNKHFNFTDLKLTIPIKLEEIVSLSSLKSALAERISKDDVIKIIALNTGMDVDVKFVNSHLLNNDEYYLFEVISE